ncbi:G2/M-specific cyclin NimE [Purpureocillium lavendulum]|uniref:G2/M-specific cyclin NimE n=1 Tax=Purpureocillium lavendulum TaxID=1247861 RepID=A0AB34G3A1_9HYPO|nr:G2/M-specific cyclin NimE [Purpureocillium lavendulum]
MQAARVRFGVPYPYLPSQHSDRAVVDDSPIRLSLTQSHLRCWTSQYACKTVLFLLLYAVRLDTGVADKPPQGRPATRRVVSDENDSTRIMTRAKSAAALHVDESSMPAKGALQTKKSAVNAGVQRSRAALGDVSNVGKSNVTEGKKAATGKVGLVSKAAHPTGVQKTRTASRAALSTKAPNASESKRTASGAGAIVGPKRKVASSTINRDENSAEPVEPVRKKAHTAAESKRVRAEPAEAKPKAAPPKAEEPKETLEPVEKGAGEPEDLDQEDLDDPLMVAEYANEIFEYLHDLEVTSIPNPQYMSHQDDLEWRTRGILVDWLIEVHTRFHLLPETLFLAVNIIDRFLSEKVVELDKLQLVGITAMFIASKYEEVLSPHVENFKRITDDGFSEAEILEAERFLLSTLNYDLSYPNPMNFLRRVSKADNYDIQSRTIGKYLMEISLLDHRFMGYRPSHCAAAAMYLARLMLDRGEWDKTLAHYAGYDEEEIEPVVELMVDYLARPVVHEAFFKKYASKKFLKASILARQWAKKNAVLFGITDIELSLDQIS